jgi:hypothetical protein
MAGVGSSPVVEYTGSGAYFLDKIKEGVWKLEVMPDAFTIRDPFEKASPKKEVTRIQWRRQKMKIAVPGLTEGFSVNGINAGNTFNGFATGKEIIVEPGIYMLTSEKGGWKGAAPFEVYAPGSYSNEPFVNHTSFTEITALMPVLLTAKIGGADSADKITIEVRNSSYKWKTVSMQRTSASDYVAEVPADMATPGLLNYRIIIMEKKNKYFYTFPGGIIGDPYAWDYYQNETYQTFVAAKGASLELFNPNTDRNFLNIYNPDWRNNIIEYTSAERPAQLVFKATMSTALSNGIMGWQLFLGDKVRGRISELGSFDKLVIRVRSSAKTAEVKVALIDADAVAFSNYVTAGSTFQDIEIPLSRLKKDSSLLLPRPYPGFLPLWFQPTAAAHFLVKNIDKLEVTFGPHIAVENDKPFVVEIESVWLKR